MKTLPNADDRANARCQIRKQQMQQAESCGSSSTSQAHQALSHPGANVYRPPMLCQQPPHLDVAVTHPNSAATNQNTTGADPAEFSALLPETVGSHTIPAPSPDILATETSLPSCCKMTMHPNTENTPNIPEKIKEKFGKIGKKSDLHSFDTYSSPIPHRNTPALETNPPNPREKMTLPNAENTSKIAKKIRKNSDKSQIKSSECMIDTLTLALGWKQEIELLEEISREDWEEWKSGWGEWTPGR